MRRRNWIAAAAGAAALGAAALGGGAVATGRSGADGVRTAAEASKKAAKALAKHRAADAVPFAERAVLLAPRDAGHRALLGRSYLEAGRFTSARAALEEAVRLDPDDGRAALGLVLAQVAGGDWELARRTLAAHPAIPAADRGLAMALAGDPAGAVAVLTDAARRPGATVKTRQNLALALAMGGQWRAARVIAAADLPPDRVDARMADWAAFAQPSRASDQVAALLGVAPAQDAGRPAVLALAAVAPVSVAAAPTAAPQVPLKITTAAAPPTPPTPLLTPAVRFGPSREVAQPLAAALVQADPRPVKVSLVLPPEAAPAARVRARPGGWFVQIGAYRDMGVARRGWGRATRRLAALSAFQPTGVRYASSAGAVYRLSVGGLARGEADRLCRRYRASGGDCFVRAGAGDAMAEWLRRGGAQLAMR